MRNLTAAELELLHLDDHLAVVRKPTGWLVWPLDRLDKGTSGVLAFALDADTARDRTDGRGGLPDCLARRQIVPPA